MRFLIDATLSNKAKREAEVHVSCSVLFGRIVTDHLMSPFQRHSAFDYSNSYEEESFPLDELFASSLQGIPAPNAFQASLPDQFARSSVDLGYAMEQLKIPHLHNTGRRGRGVIIAIIDTGSLASAIWQ